jgi:hypothetical protein
MFTSGPLILMTCPGLPIVMVLVALRILLPILGMVCVVWLLLWLDQHWEDEAKRATTPDGERPSCWPEGSAASMLPGIGPALMR